MKNSAAEPLPFPCKANGTLSLLRLLLSLHLSALTGRAKRMGPKDEGKVATEDERLESRC